MELRMLSGLHRGAVLELDAEELLLGASEQADVIVVDPGVAQSHLYIRKEGDGHFLAPSDGAVFAEDGTPVWDAVLLARGLRFRIGDIWIGFYAEGDSWQGPPSPAMPAVVETVKSVTEPVVERQQALRTTSVRAVDERGPESEVVHARWNGKIAVWIMGGVVVAVPGLAWLIASANANLQADMHSSFKAPYDVNYRSPEPRAVRALASTKSLLSPGERLLAEFKNELAQRELLDRVDFVYGATGGGWELRGAIDEEEKARIERFASKFVEQHKLQFAVRVTVVPAQDLLPFKIVEVSTGSSGNIVTGTGERLSIGDTLDGYRLVSVTQSKIVFAGKRHIELTW